MNKQKEHEKFSKKYQRLQVKEAKLQAEYSALEDVCSHPYLRYKNAGTSGNWDNYEAYWREWFCPTCNKRWTTSQDRDETYPLEVKYPHVTKIDLYGKHRDLYREFYNKDELI